MTKKQKKALITGITGQDGAYLTRFLLEKGYAVTGLLSDDHDHTMVRLEALGVAGQVTICRCPLTDERKVQSVLDKAQPDEVYNLAALSSVGQSFKEPGRTMHVNVLSVHGLLEAIVRGKRPIRMYQASSSEMFGNADRLPVDESAPLRPVSPYAISKAAGHMLTRYYRETHKLFCSSGILFNHESVLRPAHFVTKKILSTAVRIAGGSGETLHLGNIDVKRDWGYAPEYVKAMWLMLQQDEPDDFVIATGQAHSLREFIEGVFKTLDLDWERYVTIDKSLYRPADIAVICGNAAKAAAKLKWTCGISFEELVKILVREEQVAQKVRPTSGQSRS